MIQASILEQFTTLFEILKNNTNIINIIVISIIAFVLLIIASRFKNKKITKILCLTVYLGIFGTLMFLYHTEILKLFDYLINNIFLFLFFPNLAVYTLVLVVINVIIIKSTFSKNENKLMKFLNILFFIVFNIIFYLIIDNVIKYNVNVYEQLSIYTNNNLLVLIELSMKLFIVWVLILAIIKLSASIIETVSKKRGLNQSLALDNVINNDELTDIKTYPEVMEIAPSIELNEEDIRDSYDEFRPIKKIKKIVSKKSEETRIEEAKIEDAKIEENQSLMEENKPLVEETEKLVDNQLIIKEDSMDWENSNTNINSADKDLEEVTSNSLIQEEQETLNNNLISDMSIYESINLNKNEFEFMQEDNNENVQEETFIPKEENNIVNQVEERKPIITLSSYDSIFTENNEHLENNINSNMEVLFAKDENNYLKNIMNDIAELKNDKENESQIEKIYENIKMNQNDLSLNDYNNLINALLDIKNA